MNFEKLQIGTNFAPFIIAEMSGNHNGSVEQALNIVKAIKQTGASALKLQTYRAETMTLDIKKPPFLITDPKSLWSGENLFSLYKKAATPWEWHQEIFELARSLDLICFSTPFDPQAVELLEKLNCPLYKVASFEIVDLELLKVIAQTKKPVIVSTGMSTLNEISMAVETLQKYGAPECALLKCTSSYPAKESDSNLKTMSELSNIFNCPVGLSDHTLGIGAAIASIALGGCIIEKHMTLKRSDGGVDSQFSLEPSEFQSMVLECQRAKAALGNVFFGPTESEKPSLIFRRSIFIVEDLKSGDVLTKENTKSIRPGNGLHPHFYQDIIGLKVNKNIEKGTPLSWEFLKSKT